MRGTFLRHAASIVAQSIAVVIWITLNSLALGLDWDPYPFILLNLAFSTQAAYAAPLILLAETRHAERDRIATEQDEQRRDEELRRILEAIESLKR